MGNHKYTVSLSHLAVAVLGTGTVQASARKVLGVDRQKAIAVVVALFGMKAIIGAADVIGIAQEACRALKPRKHPKTGKPGCYYRQTVDGPIIFKTLAEARADYDAARAAVERKMGERFVWSQHWQALGWVDQSRAIDTKND